MGVVAVSVVMAAADPAEARKRQRRSAVAAYNPPYAALVVDANSGKVLHASNADSLRHPASLTKVMTLYLLFEQIEAGRFTLDTPLEISPEAASQAPSKLGLKPGQTIPVEQAIKALVTKSANDVAVVIAEALAGDEEKFARLMTQKARALGMSRTIYRNASGLPDSEQVTTAHDQVQLGRAIQDRFPRYYRYFSTASFSYRGAALRNHNRLLGRVEGLDGIKTGYTLASGFNLITSVHRGNRHIVAAVLGGRTARWRDARMESLIEKYIDDGATVRTAARILDTTQSIAAPLPRKRAVEPDGAAPAVAEARPSPGSFEPIRAVPVRTLTVRPNMQQGSGALAAAADSPFAPGQPSNRPLSLFNAAPSPLEHPGAETTPRIASSYAPESPAASVDAPSAPNAMSARPVPPGGWLIQVGAFAEEGEAKQRLESIASTARPVLGKADPFTERVAKDGKTFYRARFAGFDKDRAQAACSYLKRNDVACIALKN